MIYFQTEAVRNRMPDRRPRTEYGFLLKRDGGLWNFWWPERLLRARTRTGTANREVRVYNAI